MSRTRLALFGLAVVVCASAGVSSAQDPPKADTARDAITQKQIAAYRSEIQKILAKSTKDLAPEKGAGLALRGFEHVALAKATDDGGNERLCTDDVEQAVSFLTTPAVSRKDR